MTPVAGKTPKSPLGYCSKGKLRLGTSEEELAQLVACAPGEVLATLRKELETTIKNELLRP